MNPITKGETGLSTFEEESEEEGRKICTRRIGWNTMIERKKKKLALRLCMSLILPEGKKSFNP
jgi:hypothetical protein